MDLEILEGLALSEDRAAALAQLLPGSEDHDYYSCLHAQHRHALDEAERIIDAWPDRHGSTPLLRRLELRQALLRTIEDPRTGADELRDRLEVSHWHEAEVADVDPSRPTRLAPGTFDGAALLARAAEYSTDLSQVTDEGLYELLEREASPKGETSLDSTRRNVLLQRLRHTAAPQLVTLVAADLDTRGNQFGAVKVHHELTLEQLYEVARRRTELYTNRTWLDAVIRRMRPPGSIDLALDRDAREAYLVALWAFVAKLPPASNSLKAHVLWHLLDVQRRRDAMPDRELFEAFLQLPRTSAYASRRDARGPELVEFGTDYSAVTGLWVAGNDEQLVRELIIRVPADAERYARWLDRAWLDAVVAEAHLLAGSGDPERATRVLGPARAAEIRERIELAWCLHDATRFAIAEPVVLDVDVKHVPELVVNVFRVDPLAYFQHHKREVGVELDLDGLAASHELVLRYSEPPVRRVRRRIALPMCARAGTYVIDLIGNGMSSRAVIHKGRLRHVARVGAAGTVVAVLDEAGRTLAGARAWIGEREYIADADGSFVVPFSTAAARVPMLLMHGDLAQVALLELASERYELTLHLALDRQQLTAGRTAKACARLRLTCGDAPASLALLERATWDITVTDRQGVTTTRSQPLVLVDHEATVLELPLGEDVADLAVAVRGRVKVLSEQRDQDLEQRAAITISAMTTTYATEALYLARTATGWVLSALGRSGEPRAHRPISVVLVHRWSRIQLPCELATDAQGRVELGELHGVQRITATLGSHTQTWITDDAESAEPMQVVVANDAIQIGVPPSRDATELVRGMSLVELRARVPLRHVEGKVTALASAVRIAGLPPGDYQVRGPGLLPTTVRVVAAIAVAQHAAITGDEVVELSRRAPVIAEISTSTSTDGALMIILEGATAATRVHVIATRFLPAPIDVVRSPQRVTRARPDRERGVTYVSGRELGDEYRYVLDRRTARRFPSLLLAKPSLLLNPWARRTTTTDVATAKSGGGFAPAPAPMRSAAGYAPQASTRDGLVSEDEYLGYDFLAEVPSALANLVPTDGRVVVPRTELGRATAVTVIVDDPAGSTLRCTWLAEAPLEPRDLRLRVALDPDRHAMQKKAIAPLRAGEVLHVADLATAKLHLIDSVERAHAYLLALGDDATLREFAWVARWPSLSDGERREQYSKYACHELHLFLYLKDRAFFDAVVRPHLAHKRTKTFLDHYLLDAELAPYLEPRALEQLNAVELALLGRRLRAEPALVRILEDRVALVPPDPATDTRLVDALLGASTLEGETELGEMQAEAFGAAADAAPAEDAYASAAPAAPGMTRSRMVGEAPPKAAKKREAPRDADEADDQLDAERARGGDFMKADLARREAEKPMYRTADTTQEWAEHNWWHRTPADSGASMIAANRLWRDYAVHTEGRAFLSPWLGLATTCFAEAMCALAVIELPFVAQAHALVAEGPSLMITASGNALAGSSQLVDGPLAPIGAPIVVGQSYVRADDRYQYVEGEQVDKYVAGSFAVGVVYTSLVVLANPTSSRQRVAALVQIPRGSVAIAGARATQTIDAVLPPYGTHGHEFSFYFPIAGRFAHFPVHVSRLDQIVAAAPPSAVEVTLAGAAADPNSWAELSQRGTLAQVVAFLATENVAAIDLDKLLWRLRDAGAYEQLLGVLEQRRTYHADAWAYALLHRDLARIRTWLRAEAGRLHEAGPVQEMIDSDGEQVGTYEHLELAPLVNARAHRLGPKLRILNDGLAAQYRAFLELVAHRPTPTTEDLLAATSYFAAQDRAEAMLAMLPRVAVATIIERMQFDYLAAYAACLTGDTTRARELVTRWRDLAVDRWRTRFATLASMLDELTGAAAQVVDPKSRDQQQAELATRQPTFELAVEREGVVIHQQHVAALELRYFEMDIELLFSRQPFVQSDVSRFSFIEPGHRETVEAPAAVQRIPWPAQLRGKNVVVEAVGAGLRKAKIHYANDLTTHVAHQYGQVRVQRSAGGALAATYVKVYARQQNGAIAFYKDGYTDLRGWFDYATLSTDDLDRVDRFAILIASDQAGSAILEAGPPPR